MRTETPTLYRLLAGLFAYPDAQYSQRAAACRAQMGDESSEATALLRQFCEAVQNLSTEELQELFTRSFDLNPACTLEIGWHLFGEDYQRGEFLVKMRRQLRARGVEESLELPDHLTHVLALLDRMPPEEASEFAGQFLLPALHKMRGAWQRDSTPFRTLLESAFILLNGRYPEQRKQAPANIPELRVLQ
jgi:nitrate reductase delta subunit